MIKEMEMQTGTRVIRKSDAKAAIIAFGIIESIRGTKAVVRWEYNQRQQHSTLAISSLVEVSSEMEADIREKSRIRRLERSRAEDAKRIYICKNVNPTARVSNHGHPRPLPLMESQVIEGKCFYCGYPVEKREIAQ